jgi:DNA invertase Pin-like site-specific DNA recombinase
MERAVIYCRISSDPTGKAAGVRRQEADCRALADRLGLEAVQVFTDNDVSAYAKVRPAWEAMLNLVESDGINTLICWHNDRLYRRPTDLERLLDLLDKGALPGMVRTATSGDMDLATASGRMVARMLAAASAHEVEHNRERILRAHRQRAVDGRPPSGRRAFGYAEDKVTVVPEEAALIREAVEQVTAGASLRSITDDWNERGVPTRDGGIWRPTSIRNILTAPRIAGLRVHRGQVVGPGTWPGIVTEDEWRRMVASLRDPSRRRRGGAKDGRKFWLSGTLGCGLCGARLWSGSRPGRPDLTNYACPRPPYGPGCGRIGVNADKVEAHISGLLLERLRASDLGDLNPAPAGSRIAEITVELEEITERLTEIGEAIASGDLTVATGGVAERTLLETQRRLEAERRRLSVPRMGALPDRLDDEDWQPEAAELQQIAEVLLSRVVVNPAAHSGQRFTPDRLDVVWADLAVEGDAA